MSKKSRIKKLAVKLRLSVLRIRLTVFYVHIWITKHHSKGELERFIKRFRDKYISCNLVRVGGDGDGGYLHPEILDKISYCYSPGVSDTADFEKTLSEKFNIKSFMADASVEGPPTPDKNFTFIPKFLGAYSHSEVITLSDWISETLGDADENMILQMDIEGGEYDVLTFEESSTLSRFSSMTIEFHNLQKVFERDFLRMVSGIFEKIYKDFSICHVHPNNCCGVASLDGIDIPCVIEVTFIRNDLVHDLWNKNPISLPHRLDNKNVEENEDIIMPDIWWRK